MMKGHAVDGDLLMEADFLVNPYENSSDRDTIRTAYENIFRTENGKMLCGTMFEF